jgi:hypothetical protein
LYWGSKCIKRDLIQGKQTTFMSIISNFDISIPAHFCMRSSKIVIIYHQLSLVYLTSLSQYHVYIVLLAHQGVINFSHAAPISPQRAAQTLRDTPASTAPQIFPKLVQPFSSQARISEKRSRHDKNNMCFCLFMQAIHTGVR